MRSENFEVSNMNDKERKLVYLYKENKVNIGKVFFVQKDIPKYT